MKDELEMLRLIVDAEKKKVRDSETEISKLNVDLKKEKVEKKGIQENYEKIKGEMEKMIDSDKLQRGLLENENLEMRSTVHKLRESINQLEEKLLEAQRQKPDPVDENEVERLRQDNTNLIEELRRNMDEIMELEKLKNLRVDIEERDAEIERLKEEIDSMKSKLNLQDDLMEDEFKKKNDLGGKVNSLNQEKELLKKKLEKQESDRKKLNETLKKRDTDLEEKENDLRKAMESFSNLKDTNLKLRTTIEKLSKEKEDFAKKLDRVLNDLSLMKKSRDEAQDLHSRMQEEYLTFKDQLTKKDEWILKQGNEMKLVSDQYNNIKKKYLDYKNDIEAEFGKVLTDKNTEIMVLKEMIKSTKAMVRAKEVDLTRLRKKYSNQDFIVANMSDDERLNTAVRSSLGSKQKPVVGQGRMGAVGLLKSGPSIKLKPKNGRELGFDNQEEDTDRNNVKFS